MESLKDFENADTISVDTLALEESLNEEREKEITQLNSLSKKVCYLHTNLLYYRNVKTKIGSTCYEAWKTLVKKIGGTPDMWKDLGYALGISQADLDYIANTMAVKDDPANIVLKVYMQDENATLDKIFNALVKLKRYDILKAVEEPLCNLAQSFDEDSGYQSNSQSGKREIVTLKNIANDLPPALRKEYSKDMDKAKQPTMRPSKKQEEDRQKNDNPILFLTFTEDGLETALNIQHYVNRWEDIPEVTVLTLNSRREDVVQNPEKFIRENFEKAHFIVPVITTGYLNRIKSYTPQAPSTDDNLDFKYVNFIYNLIVNYYIHVSGCLNEKVRSVLPQNVNVDVLRDISMYPDLLPWTYETNFDEHFKSFLKNKIS